MENSLFSPTITNKVYKQSAIQIAAFLGGPLVAGYLIAHNFRQLGEPEKVKRTWVTAIAFFAVVLVLAVVVPQSVPTIFFALFSMGAANLYVQRFQAASLREHLSAGGPSYKTGRAVLIALGCSLVVILLFLALYALTDFYRLFE